MEPTIKKLDFNKSKDPMIHFFTLGEKIEEIIDHLNQKEEKSLGNPEMGCGKPILCSQPLKEEKCWNHRLECHKDCEYCTSTEKCDHKKKTCPECFPKRFPTPTEDFDLEGLLKRYGRNYVMLYHTPGIRNKIDIDGAREEMERILSQITNEITKARFDSLKDSRDSKNWHEVIMDRKEVHNSALDKAIKVVEKAKFRIIGNDVVIAEDLIKSLQELKK